MRDIRRGGRVEEAHSLAPSSHYCKPHYGWQRVDDCEKCGVPLHSATARDHHAAWHFRKEIEADLNFGCVMCRMDLFPGHKHERNPG